MRNITRIISLPSQSETLIPAKAVKMISSVTADMLAILCLYGCVNTHTMVRMLKMKVDMCKATIPIVVVCMEHFFDCYIQL